MDSCYNCGTPMTWVGKRRLFWCPTCRRHYRESAPSEGDIALACHRLQEEWDATRERTRLGGARAPLEVTREFRVGDGRKRRRHE